MAAECSELTLSVHDFYHDQSDLIAPRVHDWDLGYRGYNIPTMPDAVLINGIGQEDCTKAQPGVSCTTNAPAEVKGKIGSKIRFRVINPGSLTQLRISVDNHVLKVVEVDDTPIQPLFLHEVEIDPGQRVSFILYLNQGGSEYSGTSEWHAADILSLQLVLDEGFRLSG